VATPATVFLDAEETRTFPLADKNGKDLTADTPEVAISAFGTPRADWTWTPCEWATADSVAIKFGLPGGVDLSGFTRGHYQAAVRLADTPEVLKDWIPNGVTFV
jgi:hypothetical protein